MDSKTKAAERPGAQMGKPVGGFAFVAAANILRVWLAYQTGAIRFRDVRVWFAAHEQVARRCELEEGRCPHFTEEELCRLVGGAAVKASLKRLEASKLIYWSTDLVRFPNASGAELDALAGLPIFSLVANNRRLVPVPRVTLKLMAQSKPAVVAAMLGHMLRCLYYRNGEPVSWGRCKASWIAQAFGLTLRSIKAARKHLLALGWLVELPSVWKERQRWGGTFAINLAWSRPKSYADVPVALPPPATPLPAAEFSPPTPDLPPEISPPCINRELPTEIKNQKPASGGPAGFSEKKTEREPTIKHVEVIDLKSTPRLFELYVQAVGCGVISRSEADKVRFFTAAEHAIVKATSNPAGLFIHLVKNKLWHYCTCEDESAALARLKRLERERFEREYSAVAVKTVSPPQRPRAELSDDARLALAIDTVASQKGIPPMVLVRKMRPTWTLEQFETALSTAEEARLGRLEQVTAGRA